MSHAGRCASLVGARRTTSGSSSSWSELRSSTTPHPASFEGAGRISPRHTSAEGGSPGSDEAMSSSTHDVR